jgi:hypothetical protein
LVESSKQESVTVPRDSFDRSEPLYILGPDQPGDIYDLPYENDKNLPEPPQSWIENQNENTYDLPPEFQRK